MALYKVLKIYIIMSPTNMYIGKIRLIKEIISVNIKFARIIKIIPIDLIKYNDIEIYLILIALFKFIYLIY